MAKLIELSAVFEYERFRFENPDGDAIIADARLVSPEDGQDPFIKIRGKADLDELKRKATYRFYGKWTNHPKYGRQFHFQTFVEAAPHGRAGIITYLKRAGEGNGIGHARATQIYEKFGGDSVRMLREEPEVIAAAIKGLKESDAELAAKWLKERQALEACTIELTDLLDKRGMPKNTVRMAIKKWGNQATEVIKRRPYALLGFKGCGFKRCDALYMDLGLDPAKLLRQTLCCWNTIATNSDGHTWFPSDLVINGLRGQVGGTDVRPADALRMGKRISKVAIDSHGSISVSRQDKDGAIVDSGGTVWLAEGRKSHNELKLARMIAQADLELEQFGLESLWPDVDQIENIDDHQRENLQKALQGQVALLGGGPGTGKTFTGANLIKLIAKVVGFDNIAVGAPTGKAAVRITEAMNEYGIPIQARTWHSLLGIGGTDSGFIHDGGNPWPYKVIIGDESSMIDTDLMCAIMSARAAGTHLLLLGDINQLPPVGHGAPLRDFISSGVSYGELTEIKRNSGGIVEACKSIRESKPWSAGDNLKVVAESKPEDQSDAMLKILKDQSSDLDPVWDCQILVAVNEKSPLSRKELNKTLQNELNPNPAVKNCPFRINDKVVNLKNDSFPAFDCGTREPLEERAYVANGELGRIIEIEPKSYICELSAPKRVIRIPRGESGCSWDLGYALSCHKSQGSEWPVVIVMIDSYPGAKRVCSREWLYTAISRAKKMCYLVGKKSVADQMCKRTAIDKRKTFLRERICLERVKKELVEL